MATCDHCDDPATYERVLMDEDGFVVDIKDLCADCAGVRS
jgi:hypothetical protein